MRNPLRLDEAAVGAPRTEATQRHSFLPRLVEWLRTGYPADAPSRSHSPLLALNGPLSLTCDQTLRAINEIDCGAASSTDIEIAITKATNQLPTPGQVDEVNRALKKRST